MNATVYALLVTGAGSLLLGGGCSPASDSNPEGDQVVVAVPARAGAVIGTSQNSDEFIWRLFTEFTAPVAGSQPDRVVFETWASDSNTFSRKPRWPGADEPRKLVQSSVLAAFSSPFHGVDVPCSPPKGAAVGAFPVGGSPRPCIAEEVRRNPPQFNYIVTNKLNTKVGLAVAFNNGLTVAMPTDAIAVKVDWVPVHTMPRWIPQLRNIDVRSLFYTTISDSVEYALVAMHVSSRQNPNWVWGTFEHYLNPGRCDDIGCFDTFGAKIPAVRPNTAERNTQYGPCAKTDALTALMQKAKLAHVWEFYCLKSTQVDYTAADGTPSVLGNSVIERIVGNGTVAASSCIGCHVYASFGENGKPTASAIAILPYNPSGRPIPAVLAGSRPFDFMWGVLLAP